MDFLKESLAEICSISLHWSSDCNMACKYCYIEKDKPHMASYNQEIVEALKNGEYVANIKKVFADEETKNHIESLSLWGAEPTINGNYFKDFINEMLDYFPNVNNLMFSSNALLGAQWIYDKFFTPLYDYCEEYKRKLTFELQLSLDGPPEFNDDSRHPGATKNTLETINLFLEKTPMISEYLHMKLELKPTLDISYMRIMNEQGISCFNWYYQFFDKLQQHALKLAEGKEYFEVYLNQVPTLVLPGYYTVDDGKEFKKWIDNLLFVDRRQLPTFDGMPLFVQLSNIIGDLFNSMTRYNPIAHEFNSFSCSASKNNITIDHKGNLYTCNRICKNTVLPKELWHTHTMRANSNINTSDKNWVKKTWGSQSFHNDLLSRKYLFDAMVITLASCGQIEKKYIYNDKARLLLFYAIASVYCHVGFEEDVTQNPSLVPIGLLRLVGNGALESLLRYYSISQARGDICKWKSVT